MLVVESALNLWVLHPDRALLSILLSLAMAPPSDHHPVDPATPPPHGAASRLHSSPAAELPRDASVIPYEDDLEQLNSKYQLAWSEVMEEGPYSNSRSYREVHVLLLSWHEKYDDLKVNKEVDALHTVFKETFNFDVRHEYLSPHENKTAQACVNKIVADWVYEYDGPRVLLIVYFAGHGKKGKKPGDLHIAGRTSPTDLREHLNSVIWNRTEENLKSTRADVLEMFDCCCAGNLVSTRGGPQGPEPRAFEYLAAVDAEGRTPGPGATSFTSALIWALKELAKRSGRFTTNDLLNVIRKEAPDFSRKQVPILIQRDESTFERIVLEPLPLQRKNEAELSPRAKDTMSHSVHTQEIVTLKFVFDSRPTEVDIRNLGKDLNIVVGRHHLRINRIMWGGIHGGPFHQAVARFKALRRRSHDPAKLLSIGQQVLHKAEQIQEELGEVHHEVAAHNVDPSHSVVQSASPS